MPANQVTIDINATPEECFKVITSFKDYPEFIPELERIEVLHQDETSAEVKYYIKVIKRFTYQLRLKKTPHEKMEWSYVEGDFKDNHGSWQLEPIMNGTKTRITYTVNLDLGFWVPKSISDKLVKYNLPAMLNNFKKRMEQNAAK